MCTNAITFAILIGMIIFSITYLFIPFDLIDDALGFLGYIDDFIIILGLLFGICEFFMSNFRRMNDVNNNNIENNNNNINQNNGNFANNDNMNIIQ